jgi:uncharacterized protein (TIGR03435 family)
MKRLIALAVLFSGALFAQDLLVGTWQGTLQAGRELRTVVKVEKTDTGAVKGQFFSIDQGSQPMPIGTIALKDGSMNFAVPGIGGTFEGKLSADGNTITGNWKQGEKPFPLVLTRATPQTAWAMPEPRKPLKPMAADVDPVFAVATIKPSDPNSRRRGFGIQPGQFSTFNTSLLSLITFSWGVQNKQVIGGPAWINSEQYDIVGRPDGEGQPNEQQWKVMIQKLLAERFHLVFHRETRELSVYALTVAKDGQKLTPSTGQINDLHNMSFGPLGKLAARNATMVDLARSIEDTVLDRPILDRTGITGRYDFTLNWLPDEFQFAEFRVPGGAVFPENKDGVDIFTAIQQQLGLKLEPTRAQAEVMIVDRAEKPSAN